MSTRSKGLAPTASSPAPTLRQSVLRVLRRTHLYLGLLMWPFVLLFAITGLSFNHPTVGRGLAVERASADEVKQATGFEPWSAEATAEEVIRELGERGHRYRLSSRAEARFRGFPLFTAVAPGGSQAVIVSLSEGTATITERPREPAPAPPPFAGIEVRLPERDLKALAQKLNPLLAAQGVPTLAPLSPHPEVHPQLAFRMLDPAGREWNVLYDLGTGALSGKPTAARRSGALVQLLESIHTQHHYPPHGGATFFWALFADLTAITLLVWATTGLVMWWQMRRLRVVGAVVVAAALAVSAAVMVATGAELSFAPSSEE